MSAYIFDTESTHKDEVDGKLPEIIESSWMKLAFGPEGNLTSGMPVTQRFKPEGRISMGALATHHILDEELEGCPPSASFKLPDDIKYMIGHNVDFDWKLAGSPEHLKRIDTLCICRKLWPECDSHSMGALIYFHFRDQAKLMLKDAHSAEVDILNTTELLGKILDATQIKSMEALWEYSEKARIPEIMTFGKHNGAKIMDELPEDYMDWYLRQKDQDIYVAKAFKDEKARRREVIMARGRAAAAPAPVVQPAPEAEPLQQVIPPAVDVPAEEVRHSSPAKPRF